MAATDDLHVSPFRADGVTYGTPTWIWSVIVDGQLHARAYHGLRSRWYRAAVQQGAGRISSAGATHEVTFETVEGDLNDAQVRGSGWLRQTPGESVGSRDRASAVRRRGTSTRKDQAPTEAW
jgi:hypothetical protein